MHINLTETDSPWIIKQLAVQTIFKQKLIVEHLMASSEKRCVMIGYRLQVKSLLKNETALAVIHLRFLSGKHCGLTLN